MSASLAWFTFPAFMALFPLWDVLFGTFNHPDDYRPAEFGSAERYVPRNFFRQLWFPFQAQWRRPA